MFYTINIIYTKIAYSSQKDAASFYGYRINLKIFLVDGYTLNQYCMCNWFYSRAAAKLVNSALCLCEESVKLCT